MNKLYRIVLNDHEMKVLDKAIEVSLARYESAHSERSRNIWKDIRALRDLIKRQAEDPENQEEGF